MLELTGDLRLLYEPAHELGPVAVLLQQNLHSQVPTKVDVSALENGTHAAAGDLAEKLKASGASGKNRHFWRRGLNQWVDAGCALGVVQQQVGYAAERLGQIDQRTGRTPERGITRLEGDGQLGGRLGKCRRHEAIRAEPARGIERQRAPQSGQERSGVIVGPSAEWVGGGGH